MVQVVIHGTTSSSTGVGQDEQQMQQQRQLAVMKDRPQDININPISLRPDFKLFGVCSAAARAVSERACCGDGRQSDGVLW